MRTGKPGISSFDFFSTGQAIRSELKSLGGNIFGLNSTLMKLGNGDDESSAALDPAIGTREVTKVSRRQIGKTVSSNSGGVGPTSTPARTANLLGNPYMRRYEGPGANGRYNFGLDGSPGIGEYYDVYESENNHLRFLDDTVGRDLLGYTHLENAAAERSGEAENDELYLHSTYSVFGDLRYPFDNQDIDAFKYGSKRYSPTEPYVLKPLEDDFVRETMNGNVQTFKEKFEAFIPGRAQYRGSLLDMWDYMGSHYYLNLLNGVAEHGLYVENYESDQRNRVAVYDRDGIPQSDYDYFLDVDTISPDRDIKGLLGKTNRMFYEGKIKSLVNRFATLNGNDEGRAGFLNSATDHVYGLSRGRNLRKLDLTYENGYPNPYCRVWTTHYQYSKYKHLIRGKWASDEQNSGTDHYTLNREDQLMRPNKGYERLKGMTSLDPENGRPIFAPYYVNNRNKMKEDSIKRCMFSIENLAWKDIIPDTTLIRKGKEDKKVQEDDPVVDDLLPGQGNGTYEYRKKVTTVTGVAKGLGMTLTPEQRGPNGGRIMWFPPYNLKFSEQSHADWTPNEFIGRGERIYSYVNSERTGTLSFTILVDHPSIINEWTRGGKMGKTANKTTPLSKDEMILRYFAGCDSLEFNPRKEYDVPYSVITTEETHITQGTKEVDAGTEKKKVTRQEEKEVPDEEATMTFYSVFYFPNDYSAEDFIKNKKYSDGIAEMFEKGNRSLGNVGYERSVNTGSTSTGMTYNGKPYVTAKGKDGKTRDWNYPVDTRVNNEVLRNEDRYKDMTDFGLNASFYGNFWSGIPEEDRIIEYINSGNTGTMNPNFKDAISLVKIPAGTDKKYFIPAYNFYKNLEPIIKKLNSATKNLYKYDINVQGFASKHGYTSSNSILASNRAAVIAEWIRSLSCFDFNGKDSISHNGNGELEETNTATESDFKPKAARAAVVTFKIIPTKKDIIEVQDYEEVPIKENKEFKEVIENKTVEENYDTSKSDDYENDTYDNEYTYFKQINENDDMVKRYISDKVDYFDPAFHSITPEGFNARLTFLQQCVRQGPTISASDLGMGSAYGAGNLSFGRAPFCVLRIGDFFNTKICIQNINIEYDNNGIQWDLNPEGVGLQPMFANVSINFTFLGGSDISGPIARLQNAASFNYYANTSVYDRRSDYRDGFVTKEEDTAKSWSPVILNKNENANVSEHVSFFTRQAKSGDEDGKIKSVTE